MTLSSRIFSYAWNTARDGAAKFGGSARSYFAKALRMAHAVFASVRDLVQETQKEIAMELDRAAGRACIIDREGASAKQVWFLAGLLFKAGRNARWVTGGNTNCVLTKREASSFIDQAMAL